MLEQNLVMVLVFGRLADNYEELCEICAGLEGFECNKQEYKEALLWANLVLREVKNRCFDCQ